MLGGLLSRSRNTKTESGHASVEIAGDGKASKKNEMPRYVGFVWLSKPLANPIRVLYS